MLELPHRVGVGVRVLLGGGGGVAERRRCVCDSVRVCVCFALCACVFPGHGWPEGRLGWSGKVAGGMKPPAVASLGWCRGGSGGEGVEGLGFGSWGVENRNLITFWP